MTKLVKYLPPLTELKKLIERNPDIIQHYINTDGFIGDTDSIVHINNILKKLKK